MHVRALASVHRTSPIGISSILSKISFSAENESTGNQYCKRKYSRERAQTIRRVRMAGVCVVRTFTRSITLFRSPSHSLAGNSFLERGDNNLCRASDDGFALI